MSSHEDEASQNSRALRNFSEAASSMTSHSFTRDNDNDWTDQTADDDMDYDAAEAEINDMHEFSDNVMDPEPFNEDEDANDEDDEEDEEYQGRPFSSIPLLPLRRKYGLIICYRCLRRVFNH